MSAALVCAVLALAYAVADASLLFGATLPARVPAGLGMALVGAAVVAVVVSLGSGLPGAIASGQEITVVMLATLVADIAASFPAGTDPDTVFVTAVAALLATSVALGLTCHLAARYRLGRFVHYVPWPVVAGLLGGSGLVLMLAALPVLTGRASLVAIVEGFPCAHDLSGLAFGAATAGALTLAARRRAPGPALVATLVLGYALWRGIAHLAGLDLESLRAAGATLATESHRLAWPPPGLHEPWRIDWSRIAARLPFIGAVLAIALVAMLVKIGATGEILDRDVDEARELRAVGNASLVGAATLGLPGYHSISMAQVAERMHAARRLTALLVAALVLVALPFAGAVLAHAPRFLVGGLLLWVGGDLAASWLLQPRASLSRGEIGIVAAIAASIVTLGFLPGLLVGLGCALALFVLDYGRIDVLRDAVPAGDLRSNADRSAAERELLVERVAGLLVLRLHGYLFFGTAHRLLEQLRARLDAHDGLAGGSGDERGHVVLDFERVRGLDASVVRALARLCSLTRRRGVSVAFSGFPASRRAALEAVIGSRGCAASTHDPSDALPEVRVYDSLDEALQAREEALLGALPWADRGDRGRLVRALGQAGMQRLTRYADPLVIETGLPLLLAGRPAGALYLVRKGRLAVRLPGAGREVRVRSVGPGALLGELSFYLDRPASADIVAETRCRLWRITPPALERMLAEDPALASRFHRHVASTLAERLVDNGRQIRMLAG